MKTSSERSTWEQSRRRNNFYKSRVSSILAYLVLPYNTPLYGRLTNVVTKPLNIYYKQNAILF